MKKKNVLKKAVKTLQDYGMKIILTDEGYKLYNDLVSEREIIKLSRSIFRCDKQSLKMYDRRRNRQKTRQMLSLGDYDNIPTGKLYIEDSWNWD